jgi:hypothetical protein
LTLFQGERKQSLNLTISRALMVRHLEFVDQAGFASSH